MHTKNFDDKFYFLLDTLEKLRFSVNLAYADHNDKVKAEQAKNPLIVKHIFENISCGFSVPESLTIAALKFDCSIARARAVYDEHRITTRARNAYAKNFLIHTLRRRGFKIDDIALILGCSKQTVYNYTKRACIM